MKKATSILPTPLWVPKGMGGPNKELNFKGYLLLMNFRGEINVIGLPFPHLTELEYRLMG